MNEVTKKAKQVKSTEKNLRMAKTAEKNTALLEIGRQIEKDMPTILRANADDVERAQEKGVSEALVDRLRLTEARINAMITACAIVANLTDPVGTVIKSWIKDSLRIIQVRVPIGAIGMIYESRPNVTLDATILALKSGNPVLLRGGSDALSSNLAIANAIKRGLSNSNLPPSAVEICEDTDRENVNQMLKMNEYLSLIIPRGGAGLIRFVVENATVPVLETGVGNCHIFVDYNADIEKSVDIIDNAKTQRPGTCNAVETVLVHELIADNLLPKLRARLHSKGIEIRGCKKSAQIIECRTANDRDWETEYLDFVLAIKVVKDVNEAIEHIERYSTKHSESILTNDLANANLFQASIDSAAVYVNASTRFTDGEQFGFGGEIGISTQKLHARGPVALEELTTYKYIINGNYSVRG
ncbi:MAG: glutamate-5-semialdehyde dehydrogenase [Thermotogota bacterium]